MSKKLDVTFSHTKHFMPDGNNDYGERTVVTFDYHDKTQERAVYTLFKDKLLPQYGVFSKNAKNGYEYVMPYFVDKNNSFTTEITEKIGGSSVPSYLLPKMLKMFMKSKNCNVKIDFSGVNEYIPDLFDVVSGLYTLSSTKKDVD